MLHSVDVLIHVFTNDLQFTVIDSSFSVDLITSFACVENVIKLLTENTRK
jgi:hypothetical protein